MAALALLGIAFLALGAPVAALVAAIAALVVGLVLVVIKNWDKIKEFFVNAFNKAKDYINKRIENAKAIFQLLLVFLRNLKEQAMAIITQAVLTVITKIAYIKQRITEIFTAIKDTVLDKISSIKQGVIDRFNSIKETISNKIQQIKNLFNFSWGLPQPRVPNIAIEWEPISSNSTLARYLGISSLPHLRVKWAARGGIVDGATLIGAGEAGKEAIMPLEHNTEWIAKLARNISDLLIDDLGAFFSQMALPSVVSGTLIPPKIEIDIDGLDAIDSKLAQILDRMGARGGDYRFTAQINRRTLFDEVIAEAKLKQQTTGKNPLMYL